MLLIMLDLVLDFTLFFCNNLLINSKSALIYKHRISKTVRKKFVNVPNKIARRGVKAGVK